MVERQKDTTESPTTDNPVQNRTRQFLIRVANRIFTERPLSQVEVVAHLLGYLTEFTSNNVWTFLNVSYLYWSIFRRWAHLRRESGMHELVEDTVLLHGTGEKISHIQAYPYRGRVLQRLSLYDYMSVVKLKRKSKGGDAWGEVQFDSTWPHSLLWVQVLRKPGKHAMVCINSYLSTNLNEESEVCYKR